MLFLVYSFLLYYFINISFIGLVAATASEITSRIPYLENGFGPVVGFTSAVIIGIGMVLLFRNLPQSIRRTPARFQRASKI